MHNKQPQSFTSHLSHNIKACVHYYLFFHQMIALQKLWKMLSFSSKISYNHLHSFRSQDIQIFVFLSFSFLLPVNHCFRVCSQINLKVNDVINCLNKNLITHFVWYIKKEKRYAIETLSIDTKLNIKHFYGKIMLKMRTKASPRPFFNFGE